MSDQFAIDFEALSLCSARAQGEKGIALSLDRTKKTDPAFVEKAERAILTHLAAVGQADGETLVQIAKAHGAIPVDDRSFGGIFLSLSSKKRNLIRCLRSDLPRRRGHGTTGGKLWAICR